MTHMKPSQAAREAAQCLIDYLSIRGLKDGEVLRALARFEAETRKDERSSMVQLLNEAQRHLDGLTAGDDRYLDGLLGRIELAIRNQGDAGD